MNFTSDDILNILPVAVIVVDSQNRIQQWLGAAEEIYGYSRLEVIGRNVDLLNGDRSLDEEIAYSLTQSTLSQEFAVKTKDGKRLIVSSVAKTIFDNSGSILGFVRLDRDITNFKKIDNDRIIARKQTSLTDFAGGIAHDLNNVLTAVIGSMSLLRLYIEPTFTDDIRMVVEDV